MSMIDPTDDQPKSVRLRLRLSNRGTAVPGRFRTANVYLFNTQQELARKFKEECMIGKTTLDNEPILYIGAIAREGVFAELVDDKFGKHRRRIYEEIYIDEFELNRKIIDFEAWANQFNVPIHAPTTIIAQEERNKEDRERQFYERRAALRAERLAREAVGTMGAAVPYGSEATMALAAGHDHVAHPPESTEALSDTLASAGKTLRAGASKAGKTLSKAGARASEAAKAAGKKAAPALKQAQNELKMYGAEASIAGKEFGPQVYEAVLGVFEGLLSLVTVPFEWISDILSLDVLSYGQKSAQLARALDLLANAGSFDTEGNTNAAELIRELALRAINREKSASAGNKRKLKAATQLQQKLESNKNYDDAAKSYKYAKGGDSSRYKAALYRFKAVAGRDYPKNADGATVEELKTIVGKFIADLTKTMKSGVYGYKYDDGKPQPKSFKSLAQIRESITRVEKLLQETTKTAIVAAIDDQLRAVGTIVPAPRPQEPASSNAGLVGPFATAACALASDPTGCGCGGTKAGMYSSDDDDSDSG